MRILTATRAARHALPSTAIAHLEPGQRLDSVAVHKVRRRVRRMATARMATRHPPALVDRARVSVQARAETARKALAAHPVKAATVHLEVRDDQQVAAALLVAARPAAVHPADVHPDVAATARAIAEQFSLTQTSR